MRRFMVLPLAGTLLMGAVAPVSAGANTSNQSGDGRTIQGEWYSDQGYGGVYLFEENDSPYGQVFEERGEWIPCGDAEWDPWGFAGTRLFGVASSLTISLDPKLSTGSATGEFDLAIETVDECAGVYDVEYRTTTIAVDVVGTGSLAMFRNQGSFQVPGEYNQHSRYRGKERQGDGQIDLGSHGVRDFDWALMAEYSWSEHTNG